MAKLKPNELKYCAWQDRATNFYLGSRLLSFKSIDCCDLLTVFGFCAFQTVETILKATCFYFDPNFDPEDKQFRHKLSNHISHLKTRGCNVSDITIPPYWDRWQVWTRYPEKGVFFGGFDLQHLDRIFTDLICSVPFQRANSKLPSIVQRPDLYKCQGDILYRENKQMDQLKKFVMDNLSLP